MTEFIVSNIVLIQRNVEAILTFSTRATRVLQKPHKFSVGLTCPPLGNVVHNRNTCVSDLTHKPKIFGKFGFLGKLVNIFHKFTRKLPTFKILKPGDFHNLSPVTRISRLFFNDINAPNELNDLNVGSDHFSITNSTRLLRSLPSRVSLVAIGWLSP